MGIRWYILCIEGRSASFVDIVILYYKNHLCTGKKSSDMWYFQRKGACIPKVESSFLCVNSMVHYSWRLLFSPSSSFGLSTTTTTHDDATHDDTRRLSLNARDFNRKPIHLCRRDAHRIPGEEEDYTSSRSSLEWIHGRKHDDDDDDDDVDDEDDDDDDDEDDEEDDATKPCG